MDEQSEQQQFLKDLDIKQDDVFETPLETPAAETPVSTDEVEREKPQILNRKLRRELEAGRRYREEALVLGERLRAEAEARQALSKVSEEHDFLKTVEGIYGTSEPQAAAATELLKKGMSQVYESATQKAEERIMQRLEQERISESQAVKQEEDAIEEGLDRVQDVYNVELSDSDRKAYLTLLEKLSPKDREGNIVEFADFESTYEIFERTKEKASSRAKDLASRSMNRSGASQESKLETDATARFLRENGLIF